MFSLKSFLALGSFALAVTIVGCSDSTGNSDVKPLKLEMIVAGGETTCGVDDQQKMLCWGETLDSFPAPDPGAPCHEWYNGCLASPTRGIPSPAFKSFSMSNGFAHICGIGTDDGVYCVGDMLVTYDILIHLGNPGFTRYGPTDPVVALGLGSTHDCALTSLGETWCWGDNDFNVRGTGGPVTHSYDFVPNLVAGNDQFTSIVSGGNSSCGLVASGQALCWGSPSSVGVNNPPIRTNECGLPVTCVDHPVVVNHSRPFTKLAVGAASCGIDDLTDLYCWGWNALGWVGDGTTIDRQEPVKVAVPGSVVDVVAGGVTCAINSAGAAYCWGDNWGGQTGTGSPDDVVVSPTRLQIKTPVKQIALGAYHGCALDVHNTVWCWGQNRLGPLGMGDTLSRSQPVQVPLPD